MLLGLRARARLVWCMCCSLARLSRLCLRTALPFTCADTADEIHAKVRKAVTDSEAGIEYNWDTRAGVANLLDMAAAMTGPCISLQYHVEIRGLRLLTVVRPGGGGGGVAC